MEQYLRIMVVDDEEAVRESLAAWLIKDGHQVETVASGSEALKRLDQTDFDLILLDIKMPGIGGHEVLERVKSEHPEVIVVMITAYGSIKSAVDAMKSGASDYLLKPFDPEQLLLLIEKMAQHRSLVAENIDLKARLAERELQLSEDLVARSQAMTRVLSMVEEVAPTDTPVLITGETGTGKELVALAIHALSGRAFGPFVTINCGAQTETLLESELFGHERGAFTGAVKSRRGRLEMADDGTLFLDEVGDISPKMQVDLLRVLEEKRFFRIGGTTPRESNFRLICATHRDLSALVEEGQFRSDFFYRINVISIQIPPLRERPEDVPALAVHFLKRLAQQMRKRVEGLTPEALEVLAAHDWPGNVRELKNVIERAVVVCRGRSLGTRDLSFPLPAKGAETGIVTLKEVEKSHVLRVLGACQWNVTRAARLLGLDRGTLTRKIKRYHLNRPV